MRLTSAQLDQYVQDGYLVLDAPWPTELTRRLLAAVQQVAESPEAVEDFGLGRGGRTHYTLRPVQPGSCTWCWPAHPYPPMPCPSIQ